MYSQLLSSYWAEYQSCNLKLHGLFYREESYDDLKINQTTGAYSVYTNQNNTQTVISKTNNMQSNVPGDTYDNLGQDFYENISQN